MHMIASCVWLLFLLNKTFVTLADHYSHEHNQESRQSSSEIPFSSEEFDSKILSSGSKEISEDLDYITPIQRYDRNSLPKHRYIRLKIRDTHIYITSFIDFNFS